MKAIAYYITAHGYGHGTRSCDILRALRTAAPNTPIHIKTDLPPEFIRSRLPSGFELHAGACDTGLIQKDSIQIDLEASLHTIETFYAEESNRIELEIDFIAQNEIGVVVADIPAIPLAAARQAGIPSIATGNFGWDWIYADLAQHNPRWSHFSEKFRTVYAQTDLLLRQPFAEPMTAFPNQIDLPLLASPGTPCRSRIAEAYKANPDRPWIMLSFTSLELSADALRQLTALEDYELFTVEPLDWSPQGIHCLARSTASFTDLLASMDLVVTKPGFGIVSECIVNNKPIIYSDRKNFPEYDILVENIQRYCRNAFLPGTDLYNGNLRPALETLDQAPPPQDILEQGGASIAAKHILDLLH